MAFPAPSTAMLPPEAQTFPVLTFTQRSFPSGAYLAQKRCAPGSFGIRVSPKAHSPKARILFFTLVKAVRRRGPTLESRCFDRDELDDGKFQDLTRDIVHPSRAPDALGIHQQTLAIIAASIIHGRSTDPVMNSPSAVDACLKNATKFFNSLVAGLEDEEQINRFALISSSFFANQHILLEGLPGAGHDEAALHFAKFSALHYRTLRGAGDAMAWDITGSMQPIPGRQRQIHPGPIFTNILLLRRPFRYSEKTQSVIAAIMGERVVPIEGLPIPQVDPFFVMGINDLGSNEDTAGRGFEPGDFNSRITFAPISYDQPGSSYLDTAIATAPIRPSPLNKRDFKDITALVSRLTLTKKALELMNDICKKLVTSPKTGPLLLNPPSQRTLKDWSRLAKAFAVIHGQSTVSPAHIVSTAMPIMTAHIDVNFTADSEGITVAKLIEMVLPPLETLR
jgi:MoxR-like ATPase